MNDESPLVKNTFVKRLNVKDHDQKNVKSYRNHFETKVESLKKQGSIERADRQYTIAQQNSPGNINGNGHSGSGNGSGSSNGSGFTNTPQNYLKSNKFKGTFREAPQNYMNEMTDSSVIVFDKENVISIDTKYRDTDAYPIANDFTLTFEEEYTNVKKIELMSTEIPNSDQTIKSYPPELANNTMSWINEEDADLNFFTGIEINSVIANTIDIFVANSFIIGSSVDILIFNSKLNSDLTVTGLIDNQHHALVIDSGTLRINYNGGLSTQGTCSVDLGYPVYTVNFIPGNYDATSLVAQMQTSLNLVKRRGGTGQYHYYNIDLNVDTNVITLESVIRKQLGPSPISTSAASTVITVTSINHSFKTGDTVRMIGVLNTACILSTTLNGDFTITVIDFNTFQYEVNVAASATINGGGTNVLTGKPSPYKILFQTTGTLIQYNIGFNNEDSSVYIGKENPITTKVLALTNAEITSIPGNPMVLNSDVPVLRLTTVMPHQLYSATTVYINSITVTTGSGHTSKITTTTPHLMQLPTIMTVSGSNCLPALDGDLLATPTGPYTFTISSKIILEPGNMGTIIYGGDQIQLQGLRTIPPNDRVIDFYILNVPSDNQIDIHFNASSINMDSISTAQINTSQIIVEQQDHSFNLINSITGITGDSFASCTTQINNNYIGTYDTNISIIEGPLTTNTIDILLPGHGLDTSDSILIKNSTTDPVVDGVYSIQVLSVDEIRINFVHAAFTDGIGTIVTGSRITVTGSDSLPKIDGSYYIRNRLLLINVSTGTDLVTITMNTDHHWAAGDTITVSGTNSTPDINGEFIIQEVVDSVSFTIVPLFPIVSQGTSGVIINKSRFQIETGFEILVPGTRASLQRDQNVLLYRIASDSLNGNTIGGIRLNAINGVSHPIIKILDANHYIIRLIKSYANVAITAGGSGVYISSQTAGWRTHQANTVSGSSSDGSLLARAIILSGEPYLLLVSPTLNGNSTFKVNSGVNDVLAKLTFSQFPGLWEFNGFVSSPTIFDPPISKLPSMKFKMVNRDGYLFNFKDVDYAFSLKITEVHTKLLNANENTRTK